MGAPDVRRQVGAFVVLFEVDRAVHTELRRVELPDRARGTARSSGPDRLVHMHFDAIVVADDEPLPAFDPHESRVRVSGRLIHGAGPPTGDRR
jgi:hypothetical protein